MANVFHVSRAEMIDGANFPSIKSFADTVMRKADVSAEKVHILRYVMFGNRWVSAGLMGGLSVFSVNRIGVGLDWLVCNLKFNHFM